MDPREKRRHHYLYAHRVLPQLAFQDPAGFCARLSNPAAGQASLEALWAAVGADVQTALPGDGLQLTQHVLPRSGRTVFLVELPPPQIMPEAYYLAVLPGPDVLGILTLEYSEDFESGEPCTVLGGWTSDGTHLNMGKGAEPTREAFLEQLDSMTDKAEDLPELS